MGRETETGFEVEQQTIECVCGNEPRIFIDGAGFPKVTCPCGVDYDVDDLLEKGVVSE